jgi:hypothetical protein
VCVCVCVCVCVFVCVCCKGIYDQIRVCNYLGLCAEPVEVADVAHKYARLGRQRTSGLNCAHCGMSTRFVTARQGHGCTTRGQAQGCLISNTADGGPSHYCVLPAQALLRRPPRALQHHGVQQPKCGPKCQPYSEYAFPHCVHVDMKRYEGVPKVGARV